MKRLGFDPWLTFALAGLSLVGSLFVHSATLSKAGRMADLDRKQLIFLVIAITIHTLVAVFVDYRWLKTRSFFLWGGSILSLIGLLIFANPIKGAKSWFRFRGFSIEPAEFAKLATGLCAADFLSERGERGLGPKVLFILGLLVAIPAGLVLQQPALGMALSFAPMFLALAWIAPFPRRMLAGMLLAGTVVGLGASTFVYNNLLKEYQRNRIRILFNPELDPQGAAYHVTQSKIAIGSGGLTGQGFAKGSLNRLNYVPEQHTDFIFAVICEESGLAGALVVFGLYAILFYRTAQIAMNAADLYGLYLTVAIGAVPLFQATVNIGMVMGLLPVTGIPLPFISYGGTSLIAFWMSFGFVQSVHRRRFGGRAEAGS